MLRKIVCAAAVLSLCVGVALADEFTAVISKVSDGKVTFAKGKFNKDTKKFEKDGADMTLPADGAKVVTAKFNKDTKKTEAGEALEGGLKNELFSKGETRATIITSDDNKKITEIRVFQRKGK